MNRAEYKRLDELAAWDQNKGCRGIVKTNRPLKKRLRKMARKQVNRFYERMYENE